MKDLFKIWFEGTTKLSSFYVFTPGPPSTCSGVRYHLSLEMRSAVAQSFSFSASELRRGVGKLHGATLVYRKTAQMQESEEQDWQRYVLGCLVMILERKQAWAAADIKLLFVQLFPGKRGHLNTLLLAFTRDCPLHHAKRTSACVCSPRQLRFLESRGSKTAEPNCQGSAYTETQIAQLWSTMFTILRLDKESQITTANQIERPLQEKILHYKRHYSPH